MKVKDAYYDPESGKVMILWNRSLLEKLVDDVCEKFDEFERRRKENDSDPKSRGE